MSRIAEFFKAGARLFLAVALLVAGLIALFVAWWIAALAVLGFALFVAVRRWLSRRPSRGPHRAAHGGSAIIEGEYSVEPGTLMSAPRSWDVFCRVVDNFGDVAVCWRLARGLAAGTGGSTRLWINDLGVLHALLPQFEVGVRRQSFAGVEICHWAEDADFTDFEPVAEVVVDGFGGGIPDAYANAMVARASTSSRSLWIVLEYLSAEPWVASHHGLPSPHPQLPLERYFFFPGFAAGTGGLLREAGLATRREEFRRLPQKREAFWRKSGFALPEPDAKVISLFGYENPAVAGLLEAWASGDQVVVAAVPEGRLRADVAAYLGLDTAPSPRPFALKGEGELTGTSVRRGALEVRFLPFLAQNRYDELLWASDWNFVRGEDSFVRAQWAERPFVWQVYPQSDRAHVAKLEAFLEAYCRGLAPELGTPLAVLWRGWNGVAPLAAGAMAEAWSALAPQGAVLQQHARAWAQEVQKTGDLARNLTQFCAERLK